MAYAAHAPVVEYLTSAPAVSCAAPARVVDIAPASAVHDAPAHFVKSTAPAPAVYAEPARGLAPATAVCAAPVPTVECEALSDTNKDTQQDEDEISRICDALEEMLLRRLECEDLSDANEDTQQDANEMKLDSGRS